jgi:hypothetical protein
MLNKIKINSSPRSFKIISEPYVIYTNRGYQAAMDVLDYQKNEQGYIMLSSISLSDQLIIIQEKRNGLLNGALIRIYKESDLKFAQYIIEQID